MRGKVGNLAGMVINGAAIVSEVHGHNWTWLAVNAVCFVVSSVFYICDAIRDSKR